VVGWDGFKDVQLLVNGDSLVAPPIDMSVGESHRLRFINIGMADPAYFTIKRDSSLADWTPIAKDGADLPPSQRGARKAKLLIDVGQTYDFEFRPLGVGEYVLSTPTGPKDRKWVRRIIVR
jgi:FtsP/CotA-like multicopper oxidase with cupredoxin domain